LGFGRVGGGGGGGCALHACRCLRWVRGGFVWVFSMAVFFLLISVVNFFEERCVCLFAKCGGCRDVVCGVACKWIYYKLFCENFASLQFGRLLLEVFFFCFLNFFYRLLIDE
jgi:hypothetical protein